MFKSCFDIEVNTFECEWTIKKIQLLKERSKQWEIQIKSDFFFGGDSSETKWHLECRIRHECKTDSQPDRYVFLFSAVCDTKLARDKEFWLKTATSHTSNDGIRHTNSYELVKISTARSSINIFTGYCGDGTSKNMYVSDDQFILCCKFDTRNDIISPTRQCALTKIVKPKSGIYLAELLANEKFSDVTFILGNVNLKAHKNILATRSPVFAAMFEHPMKEENENKVIIDDIKVNVFKEMLQYIYTNEVPNLRNMARKLLYAADKYSLEELKELCGMSILNKITVENAIESLIFAKHHDIKSLQDSIQNFIDANIDDVITTVGYKSIEKGNPQFAIKILRRSLEQSPFNKRRRF